MSDLCRINLTGRLTKPAELRHTPSGTAVTSMRLAYSTRTKDAGGNWVEKPNYIDLTLWGSRGEAIIQYLDKGKQLAIDGRLEFREWEAQDGTKRNSYEVVVDDLVFVGGRSDGEGGGGNVQYGGGARDDFAPAGAATSTGGGDFQPGGTPPDDDIPF